MNVNSKTIVLIYNNQCSINSEQMEIAEYYSSAQLINWKKTDEFSMLAWSNQIPVDVWVQVAKHFMQLDSGRQKNADHRTLVWH